MSIKIYSPQKIQKNQLVPREYRDVARGMEQQFAEFMIKQMEKTIGRKSDSVAENYYGSLMASERANILSKANGGLGLQDIVLDQIYPQKLRSRKAFQEYNKQQAIGKR